MGICFSRNNPAAYEVQSGTYELQQPNNKRAQQTTSAPAGPISSDSRLDGLSSIATRRTARDAGAELDTHTPSLKSQKRTASEVYRQKRLYHGTTISSKESIQDVGFDASRKVGGATGEPDEHRDASYWEAAASHNYLTSSKTTAKQYGVYASASTRQGREHVPEHGKPALVRVLGASDELSLEHDPDSGAPDSHDYKVAFRTNQPIPPRFVLASKRGTPGADAEVFQKELAKANLHVSTARAGELLREQQSDSEDDF